ncbi:MAG TPA: sporulation protein YjcZ [Candidatus Onthousia faecigallinarum]|nr:sporulation protein YjcZ [Candidatus Onthousia faecigallinarum]
MYYYGGGSCGCGSMSNFWWPSYGCGWGSNQGSNYAIILVLFILLVIVIGARYSR